MAKRIVFLVPGRTSGRAGVGPTWAEHLPEAEAQAIAAVSHPAVIQ